MFSCLQVSSKRFVDYIAQTVRHQYLHSLAENLLPRLYETLLPHEGFNNRGPAGLAPATHHEIDGTNDEGSDAVNNYEGPTAGGLGGQVGRAEDPAGGGAMLTPAELLAEDPQIALQRQYWQGRKESLDMVKKLLAAF
jgi:hypothetical protein